MVHVIRKVILHKLRSPRFPVVGEVKKMNEVRFLALDSVPTKVDDALQTKNFMILLPSMANQNGVGVGERNKLEFGNGCKFVRV